MNEDKTLFDETFRLIEKDIEALPFVLGKNRIPALIEWGFEFREKHNLLGTRLLAAMSLANGARCLLPLKQTWVCLAVMAVLADIEDFMDSVSD